ncbi:MAG TPA: response regulator [Ktedonobacteraceae bacterium]|nr:response regulator [Ktedonobacteraceae bacterium]
MAVKARAVPERDKLIAIVEDDPRLIGMFHDMLDAAGSWHLHVFSDGQDAKDQLPELGAHLILLDVGLPNLDGASLYKILRGHSNTRNTPIIVITGSHDWELHRMGLQTGLLLRKPFKMDELLCMIQALLPEEEGQET